MTMNLNKVALVVTAALALMLAVVPVAMSQEKSLEHLFHEFRSAQEEFYATFNSINSDDEFDVVCREDVPFGKSGMVYECKAVFLREYEAELAKKYSRRLSKVGVKPIPDADEVDRKQELLRAEIVETLASSPHMQQLYKTMVEAKTAYDAKQQNP